MENLISLNHIDYILGTQELFKNLSCSIERGDRIGLIGENGKGKSTLLNLINKKRRPDSGEITYRKGLILETVEQFIPKEIESMGLFEAIKEGLPLSRREEDEYKVYLLLDELAFPLDYGDKKVSELSGGEKNKVMIARAFINDPDIVLFDEPTNHLDLHTLEEIKAFLQRRSYVTLLVISHDRDFLDEVTNRTFFLRDKKIYSFHSSYSKAKVSLLKLDEDASHKRACEEKEIERLKISKKRLEVWGIMNEKFAYKAKNMEKRIEKLENEKTFVTTKDRKSLELYKDDMKRNGLIHFRSFSVKTMDEKRLLFSSGPFSILKGDKIAILGKNGSGKTTFFKKLLNQENERDIVFNGHKHWFHPELNMATYEQELKNSFGEISLRSWIRKSTEAPDKDIIVELVKAGFSYDEHDKKVSVLSGGEKSRLNFVLFKLNRSNLFILDEPTNHLDFQGREDLEEQLKDESITAIFTSHDKYFFKNVATRVFVIESNILREIL